METNQELGHNLSSLDTNGWNSNGGSRDGENGMGLEDVEETESTGLGDKVDVNREGEEEK